MEIRKRILRPFARRFFAGETLADALARVRESNRKGIGVTLDFLGEEVTAPSEAAAARSEYARAISAIPGGNLDASVSVKLTHLGLGLGRGVAEEAAREICLLAKQCGIFVWLDMEGSRYTDETIDIYRMLTDEGFEAGIALQAYLMRTWTDVKSLAADHARIRLVKGAYNEPPEIAFQEASEVRARFRGMMEYLFETGADFAVGTHDRVLVKRALALSGGSRPGFEFQMLMGMRDDLKRRLVGEGYRVVEYVPYGMDWYGYGMRRLKERRRNALYFAQGLMGR